MDSGFHNQQPGFWITIMVGFRIPLAGFRIPKPWIPDSTDQNYLDLGFRTTLHGAKNSHREEITKLTFRALALQSDVSKQLWCSVGGEVNEENFQSKRLIRFKFPPKKDHFSVVVSFRWKFKRYQLIDGSVVEMSFLIQSRHFLQNCQLFIDFNS